MMAACSWNSRRDRRERAKLGRRDAAAHARWVGLVEDVAEYFSLTPTTVRALMWLARNPPAEWPRTVTRIGEADGYWRVVREAQMVDESIGVQAIYRGTNRDDFQPYLCVPSTWIAARKYLIRGQSAAAPSHDAAASSFELARAMTDSRWKRGVVTFIFWIITIRRRYSGCTDERAPRCQPYMLTTA